MIDTDQSNRRRQRAIASVLSLALLLLLIGGYCALRSGGEEGRLGSVSTATVQVTVNVTPEAGDGADGGGLAGRPGRRPPILAEVLGAFDEPEEEIEEVGFEEEAEPEGEPEDEAAAEVEETPTPQPDTTATPPSGATPGTVTDRPAIFNVEGLVAPGAYVTGGIRISNSGNGPFRYAVSMIVSGDGTFASVLKLRISSAGSGSCSYAGAPPDGDNFLSASGLVLYEGDFAAGDKVGSPEIENGPGDQVLAAGQSEVLCLEVFYPWGADNETQGQSVNGTIIFTAKTPS